MPAPVTAPPTAPHAAAVRTRRLDLPGLPATGLDLDLATGDRWLITGAAGSGKTTLARTLLGLISPAAGQIELLGADLDHTPPETLLALRRKVALVTASDGLFPAWSAFDNLMLPLRHHGLPATAEGGREDEAACQDRLLARLRHYRLPADWLDQPVTRRSRDQRRLLALIRSVYAAPHLIVIDGVALGPLLARSDIDADALLADALAADPAILALRLPAPDPRTDADDLPAAFRPARFRRGQLAAGRLQWAPATD